MSGPKYLYYPAALLVALWGIKGVSTGQPGGDPPSATLTAVKDISAQGLREGAHVFSSAVAVPAGRNQ